MRLRRCILWLLLVGLVGVTIAIHERYRAALHPTGLYTGWCLASLVLMLAVFNARKKLPFIPLGSGAAWLEFHIAAGLLAALTFGLHTGWGLPSGLLEAGLAVLFSLVMVSGVVGLALSRALPSRLSQRGENVLYERIPAIRKGLCEAAEDLAFRAGRESDSPTISDFYARRLAAYFAAPRHFWSHLVESRRPRHALLGEVDAMDRYLDDSERSLVEQLKELIRVKDDLDYQYAGQSLLKYWLFVHIPLTYGLILFTLLHVLMVYSFRGTAF